MKSYTMALLSAVLVSHASGIALNTGQKESHPTYSLVEKVRKKKNDDVDFAALGGLFGGLAGVIGESVGGEAGRQINNTGKLVSGVSTTAANGGSSGDIVAALASGAGNFSLDSNIAWKLEDAGKAIGGSIDSLDAGDVGGALHSFSGATSQIPGVGGDIMSLTANSLGDIVNAGKENDATSIVGSLGNMTGSIAGNFGGPTGAII